jgi:deoxyribodipyrimidine photolyase-related protein
VAPALGDDMEPGAALLRALPAPPTAMSGRSRRHVLVLGDQLTRVVGPLAGADPATTTVILVESDAWGRRRPYHGQKLVLVWSAMRHFAAEARDVGLDVAYRRAGAFEEGIAAHLEDHPGATIELMEPADHGVADAIRAAVEGAGGRLEVVPNALWLSDAATFDARAAGRRELRLDTWYRAERRRTGWLMVGRDGTPARPGDPAAGPAGGSWSFDAENRRVPPPGHRFPPPPTFPPDAITREVLAEVGARFPDHPGSLDGFAWPVTRADALAALADFVAHRLAEFGPYEDALVDGERVLAHSLLSVPLNLGLVTAAEACAAVLAAAGRDEVPLASVEAFVRQLLGWREFLRHVYRREMPGLRSANVLGHDAPLPAFYWTGDTRMRCLGEAVRQVIATGHAHHIQRLMVLGSFALLAGVEPGAVNDWFLEMYVDAFDWVVTPNVIGMSQFATGGTFTSKPYVSGGAYLDRMGDHCGRCPYDPRRATGPDACPFTTLYWDVVDRHAERFAANPRMTTIVAAWRRRDEAAREAIRARAAEVRAMARAGTL